jgi:hypothetical protein
VDTTAPQLLEFDFFPRTAYIATGPAKVTVNVHVQDDLSGFGNSAPSVGFFGPSNAFSACERHSLVSGTNTDQFWTCSVTILQFSQTGIWLARVNIGDAVGNGHYYYSDELDDLGFPVELSVTTQPPDPNTIDTDGDGCSDGEELGDNPALGGQRDRYSPWDFFDTPVLDRAITIGDLTQVVVRFGAVEGASANYHQAYDRTPLGPNAWNIGPPDGRISIVDVTLILHQFGHACHGPL